MPVYRNSDGRYPSLLVPEGQTVTISASEARASGISFTAMQPRTTAALMVLAGQTSETAPRLSDRAAFEEVKTTDGLVSFSMLDRDGRLAGYSVPFLKGLLKGFDAGQRTPPSSVKRLVPLSRENDCRCHQAQQASKSIAGRRLVDDVGLQQESTQGPTAHSIREIRVPDFVLQMQVYSLFMRLGEVVVERNGTLILDSDISFAIADNVIGYVGSRIVQRASSLTLDVTNLMRGGLIELVHHVSDVLKINFQGLAAQTPTKP